MTEPFLIQPNIVDGERRRRAVECLRAAQVTLPSWSELADPARIPAAIASSLKSVGPDEPNAKNLWRVQRIIERNPGFWCREPEVRTHRAAQMVANFGFKSGTRIIELLASFDSEVRK